MDLRGLQVFVCIRQSPRPGQARVYPVVKLQSPFPGGDTVIVPITWRQYREAKG
jgi:hypothetical protein